MSLNNVIENPEYKLLFLKAIKLGIMYGQSDKSNFYKEKIDSEINSIIFSKNTEEVQSVKQENNKHKLKMETIGNLIDKLTVTNIRIWMAEDVKRNVGATDSEIAKATKVTNIANQQRNDLIQEIDEMINDVVINQKPQKLYKQGSTKMYGKN